MQGMAPDYEHLTVIQKVEVFEHALDSTSGGWRRDLLLACAVALLLLEPVLVSMTAYDVACSDRHHPAQFPTSNC